MLRRIETLVEGHPPSLVKWLVVILVFVQDRLRTSNFTRLPQVCVFHLDLP
jgi:hypothetical protein